MLTCITLRIDEDKEAFLVLILVFSNKYVPRDMHVYVVVYAPMYFGTQVNIPDTPSTGVVLPL